TGVTTMAMSGTNGACSLRQFALACMYYMREGLLLDSPYSYTGAKHLILAPHKTLMLVLPPDESHVRYFGAEAMREMKRCIDDNLFADTSAEFNLNRIDETISTTRGGAFKRIAAISHRNESALKRRRVAGNA